MTEFIWNGKPVKSRLAKVGVTAVASLAILSPVLIIAAFVAFFAAVWNHNPIGIFVAIALAILIRIKNLKTIPFRKPTLSDYVRYLGAVSVLAGLWFHIEWLVVVGLLLMIRITK